MARQVLLHPVDLSQLNHCTKFEDCITFDYIETELNATRFDMQRYFNLSQLYL